MTRASTEYSSARSTRRSGISAGIDLSLAPIEGDHGSRVALAVARELVVYVKRPGGQNQFSEPLQFQLESPDRFSDLTAWLMGHYTRICQFRRWQPVFC